MEVPRHDLALRWSGGIRVVGLILIRVVALVLTVTCSTQLDAEKRLALQEEKQALEAKLLEV